MATIATVNCPECGKTDIPRLDNRKKYRCINCWALIRPDRIVEITTPDENDTRPLPELQEDVFRPPAPTPKPKRKPKAKK